MVIKDNEQQARLISQCKNFRLRHETEKLRGGEEPITSLGILEMEKLGIFCLIMSMRGIRTCYYLIKNLS